MLKLIKKINGRKMHVFFALTLIIVSLLFKIYTTHIGTSSLLLGARKVRSVGALRSYTWMPGGQRLFTFDRENGLINAMCLDIKTGNVNHYPQAESFITQRKSPIYPHILSPDGKTLLVLMGASVKHGQIGTVDLQSAQWHPGRKKEFPLGWLNDSHHWIGTIERNRSDYLILHDSHIIGDLGAELGRLPGWDFLGCTSHGTLLFCTVKENGRYSENPVGIIITEFSMGSKQHEHQFEIRSPTGTEILNIALSPQGDRLVWQVQIDQSDLSHLIARTRGFIWPEHPLSEIEEDALWISKVDGSNMRELGRIEVQRPATFDGPPGSNLKQVKWTVDGTKISFIYKNEFYIEHVN